MPFVVVYDADALYPNAQRDLLIRIAQAGLVQAKWTAPFRENRLRHVPASQKLVLKRSRGGTRTSPSWRRVRMSMIDNAPAVAHNFQDCTDPDCREVLCEYYRAGLAAGSEFIRGTARGLLRMRAATREAADEAPEL